METKSIVGEDTSVDITCLVDCRVPDLIAEVYIPLLLIVLGGCIFKRWSDMPIVALLALTASQVALAIPFILYGEDSLAISYYVSTWNYIFAVCISFVSATLIACVAQATKRIGIWIVAMLQTTGRRP